MSGAVIFADYITFFADFITSGFSEPFHPGCHRLSRLAFDDTTKSAVTAVATLLSQLLGSDGTLGVDSLTIETDEMIDAQIVDIGIVINAQTGEILAEIEAVNTNLSCESGKRNVILQIEMRFLTILFQ